MFALLPLTATYVLTTHTMETIMADPYKPWPKHKGHIVVITGCSSGIGKSAAINMAKNGFLVFAGVRSESAANELVESTKGLIPTGCVGSIVPVILDVTKQDQIDKTVMAVSSYLEDNPSVSLAAVINNAGVAEVGAFEKQARSPTATLQVNMIGVMNVTQAFLPLLRQSKGRVVIVGSMHGRLYWGGYSVYSASKQGIKGFAMSLRQELAPLGVSVSLIEAGLTKSNIGEKTKQSLDVSSSTAKESSEVNVYEGLELFTRQFVGNDVMEKGSKAEETTDISILKAVVSRRPSALYLPSAVCVIGSVFAALPNSVAPLGIWMLGFRIANGLREGWRRE
ncbi:hypothetical protein HDU76_012860 [Blyttiomyces sp. JEL0837]|nr:hypothetical protein HDU76_012860 [Blyttiomyces sp. JEL0837]